MGINPILLGVIVYLLLGMILLGLFDLLTKRIRAKFTQATAETQQRLTLSGNLVGGKTVACLFIGAVWLLWPMVFVGALTREKESEDGS